MTFIVIVFTIIEDLAYKIIEHETAAHSLDTMKCLFLHEGGFITAYENTLHKQQKGIIRCHQKFKLIVADNRIHVC